MKSWRTTTAGIAIILWAFWLAHICYVPAQSLKFNLEYALAAPETMLICAIGLIHARDHKTK